MVLEAHDGSRITLDVTDYEFPHLATDPHGYDRNWTRIRLRVAGGRTPVDIQGPYLLTWELEALATWFRRVVAGDGPLPFDCMERILGLTWKGTTGATVEVRTRDVDGDDEIRAFLVDAEPEMLRSAARAIDDMLRRFPPREAQPMSSS